MDNEFVLKSFQSLSDMKIVVCTTLLCINAMLDTAEQRSRIQTSITMFETFLHTFLITFQRGEFTFYVFYLYMISNVSFPFCLKRMCE